MVSLFEYDENGIKERGLNTRMQRPYRIPNPITPIPRRASAAGAVTVRSRYSRFYEEGLENDITQIPTVPQSPSPGQDGDWGDKLEHPSALLSINQTKSPLHDAFWRDEQFSPSLYDESLVRERVQAALQFPIEISEPDQSYGPAFPLEGTPASKSATKGLTFPLEIDEEPTIDTIGMTFPLEIDEEPTIDTIGMGVPLLASDAAPLHQAGRGFPVDISEVSTQPPPVLAHRTLAQSYEPLLAPLLDAIVEADTFIDDTLRLAPSATIDTHGASVKVSASARGERALAVDEYLTGRPAFVSNPPEYIRWWLLSPGHLEFLCWLIGAIVLAGLLCMVLVAMGLGLGWMSFGHGG